MCEVMKADRDALDLHHKKKEQGFEKCPPELQREIIFSCGGLQFKLWYNFVAPGDIGVMPMNRWWILSHNWPKDNHFRMPLGDKLNSMNPDDIIRYPALISNLEAAVKRINK